MRSDRAAILAFFSGAKERIGYTPTGGFMGKSKLFTQLYSETPQPKHRVLEMAELVLQFGPGCSQNYLGAARRLADWSSNPRRKTQR